MKEVCNHEINNCDTTLQRTPKHVLIYPEIVDYYCTVCKKCFRYIKDSDGKLSLIKE